LDDTSADAGSAAEFVAQSPSRLVDPLQELRDQLATMKNEIGGLQIEAARAGRPWYRQASVVIAVLALLFSAATTYYANERTAEQDDRAARAELGLLIQRLSVLPKENAELQATYADDPIVMGQLGSSINSENLVLAQQAADLIDRIPDRVSATEYYAVATALMLSGFSERAGSLLERGLRLRSDLLTRVALLRTHGFLFFTTGQLVEGRRQMQAAIDLYAQAPAELQAQSNAYTEIQWAFAEEAVGQCREVDLHVARAQEYVAQMIESPYRALLSGQIGGATSHAGQCP
jgi:hypothetical protein